MELKLKLKEITHKYKYAALVLVIGLLLMIIPFGNTQSAPETTAPDYKTEDVSLEHRLSLLLSNMEGAGRVEVILTVASGEEVIYQSDENRSVAENANSSNIQTVTITDSERNETGLIRQVNPENYKGAIILCSGANDPAVRLQLVEAVSRITGLGANCISVLKMK